MSYTRAVFEQCTYNPFASKKMVNAYPILAEIIAPEWAADPHIDTLLRYTIMVYDPKSPIAIAERDLNYRKGIAMEMLAVEDDAFRDALYTCTYPILVELTVKYLVRFVRSKEWAAIAAIEFKFWEAIRLIMQPISTERDEKGQLEAANKKQVLSISIDESMNKIDLYYRKFFGEDDEMLNKAKKRLTPELMAGKTS